MQNETFGIYRLQVKGESMMLRLFTITVLVVFNYPFLTSCFYTLVLIYFKVYKSFSIKKHLGCLYNWTVGHLFGW